VAQQQVRLRRVRVERAAVRREPVHHQPGLDATPPGVSTPQGQPRFASTGRAPSLSLSLFARSKAVETLSPFTLRLGGSLQDKITYQDHEGGDTGGLCVPMTPDPADRLGYEGGCLELARWKELTTFCSDHGCRMLFGLNELVGRTQVDGKVRGGLMRFATYTVVTRVAQNARE
jgi:hypothetical protein